MKRYYFYSIGAWIIISFFCAGFQCNKNETLPKPEYQFFGKFTLSPYQKVYSIDDTIWLQFKTDTKRLFDTLSKKWINTDTTSFNVNFSCDIDYPLQKGGYDTVCEILTPIPGIEYKDLRSGQFSDNAYLYFSCTPSSAYFVKVGLVLKQRGIYTIGAPWGRIDNCNQRILPFPLAEFSSSFDLADCNKDIYLSIPSYARDRGTYEDEIRSIENKQCFAFEVR